MFHGKDWLPTSRTGQLAMAKNWHSVLGTKGTQWQITAADVSELKDIIEDSDKALTKAMAGDRSAVVTARCKEAFDPMISFMRNMKKRKFFIPPLLNSDFVSLGLNPPGTTTTPIPPPTAQVIADITFPGIHLVELRNIRAVEGGLMPDPRSDYGVKMCWGIMGHPTPTDKFHLTEVPTSGHDLPHSKFRRRKKELFDFDGESGNTIYFCLRYENPRGEAGPFGPMLSAVIP
ncbi:MAG: hypothetical protein LBH44_14605 [Treponema sp.]|jgi:hypothetical protein|nr:hypothetical protein [Treponema sp.]